MCATPPRHAPVTSFPNHFQCLHRAILPLAGLADNDYDKTKCKEAFDAYNECKRLDVRRLVGVCWIERADVEMRVFLAVPLLMERLTESGPHTFFSIDSTSRNERSALLSGAPAARGCRRTL